MSTAIPMTSARTNTTEDYRNGEPGASAIIWSRRAWIPGSSPLEATVSPVPAYAEHPQMPAQQTAASKSESLMCPWTSRVKCGNSSRGNAFSKYFTVGWLSVQTQITGESSSIEYVV